MGEQLNVLIIDRDTDARECLRDLLEVEGYQAMSAPPGDEAKYLLQQSTVPCVVLLNKIGTADETSCLQQLALLEHERYLLSIALEVLNQDRSVVEMIDDVEEPRAGKLISIGRARPRRLHPIAGLVKTTARVVAAES